MAQYKNNRKLKPDMLAVVEQNLEPNEMILSYENRDDEKFRIMLIDREFYAWIKKNRIGRGGSGRHLRFQKIQGKWVLVDTSHWLS